MTLLKNMEDALQRLTGNERQVVFVPKDKWPQIRKDFLQGHGFGKKSSSAGKPSSTPQSQASAAAPASRDEPPLPSEEDAPTEEAPVQDEQVAAAQKIFGSEIVKVEDN